VVDLVVLDLKLRDEDGMAPGERAARGVGNSDHHAEPAGAKRRIG